MYKLLQENLINQFKQSFKLQPNTVLVLKGQEDFSFVNVFLKGKRKKTVYTDATTEP